MQVMDFQLKYFNSYLFVEPIKLKIQQGNGEMTKVSFLLFIIYVKENIYLRITLLFLHYG